MWRKLDKKLLVYEYTERKPVQCRCKCNGESHARRCNKFSCKLLGEFRRNRHCPVDRAAWDIHKCHGRTNATRPNNSYSTNANYNPPAIVAQTSVMNRRLVSHVECSARPQYDDANVNGCNGNDAGVYNGRSKLLHRVLH